ncbi:MAG: 30S ribosomal protein S12 methylthiotransferase RimO [Clostridia bacterium]|nr:30S ribosomal protein S12 methylthiotransferase RimO [Clostridia bacterium]
MKPSVGMVSLGCSKNRVDSENLLGFLAEKGYPIVADPAEAEIIFVNTCGFIEPAKVESIDTIFEMAQYKQAGRLQKLFVTGCLSQRYSGDLAAEMPEVDGFLGVKDYDRIAEMMEEAEQDLRPVFTDGSDRFFTTRRVLTTPDYTAYVKISDGCNNRCTFCAIPLIRGRYESRPFDDIVDECRALAARGVTEITLIAQDTSRYGNDFEGHPLLLKRLLQTVSEIEGVHWVRVLYTYPDTVNEELLDAMVSIPKVAPYLDLPLQHINGRLLKAMNRRGTPEHIRKLVAACHERGIVTRTTMIVGFPGETEAEFQELLDFVRDARFERLGAFTYSPEEGTVAADMPDQIDEDVKQRRLDELMMLQQAISMEANESRVGEVCEVLVDGREGGEYIGRSLKEAPEIDGNIRFTSSRELKPGAYVTVKITGAEAYDLTGEEVR